MNHCTCTSHPHQPRLIVVTGGPGAGKTATLEVMRRHFCSHVGVLPEAASILFSGGFPRRGGLPARAAAQRAICRVQRELERMVREEQNLGLVLCDRGTVDAAAYWPGEVAELWADLETTLAAELTHYAAVIHLRPPADGHGYDHSNPTRTETAAEAAVLDQRILEAWSAHPRRFVVGSTNDFLAKVTQVLALVRAELPACCRAASEPDPDSP